MLNLVGSGHYGMAHLRLWMEEQPPIWRVATNID